MALDFYAGNHLIGVVATGAVVALASTCPKQIEDPANGERTQVTEVVPEKDKKTERSGLSEQAIQVNGDPTAAISLLPQVRAEIIRAVSRPTDVIKVVTKDGRDAYFMGDRLTCTDGDAWMSGIEGANGFVMIKNPESVSANTEGRPFFQYTFQAATNCEDQQDVGVIEDFSASVTSDSLCPTTGAYIPCERLWGKLDTIAKQQQ